MLYLLFFFEHIVTKLFKNWILKLDKSKFKTYVYHVGEEKDYVTDLIKKKSDNFFHITDLESVIDKIISSKLDVLIFLDIGMVPKMQIIGSLKLAKVQCCTWGVPVTTGLKNIDYFFSGEDMETEHSQQHYSEKLIKLPACSVDYDSPKINSIDPVIKKKKDRVFFLSVQSNFKLLPQHDHIFFEIIKKNPKSKFWFIGTKNEFVANKFRERIKMLCKKNNLYLDDYFYFFPQTNYQKYLNIINKSDIILDSLDWSGFNTSLDALSLDKPIITLPSNFMRGRHTYGILKNIKIDELICNSKSEYIDLSVKLSTNINFRDKIIEKIKMNKKLIFNNLKTTKFIEDFL